jgi:hypothetical protein
MVDILQNQFNIFISYSSGDNLQYNIFSKLCESYADDSEINIIDVDDAPVDISTNLGDDILKKINGCDLMICILTPIQNEDGTLIINNNVILELGYAKNALDDEKIYVFIEEDEEKKRQFQQIIPSMLIGVKYSTYTTYEDLQDLIASEYNKKENFQDPGMNDYLLSDKRCVSLLKCYIAKVLNNENTPVKTKISKIHHYLECYPCYEIIETIFLFFKEHITKWQLEYNFMNCFFDIANNHILDYQDQWIQNKNNQIKILNLLKLIEYQIFKKYGNLNKKKINACRRNFALILYELLKNTKYSFKHEINNLLTKSISDSVYSNYEIFCYKLKQLKEATNTIEKNKYEDMILSSKTTYNKFWIE